MICKTAYKKRGRKCMWVHYCFSYLISWRQTLQSATPAHSGQKKSPPILHIKATTVATRIVLHSCFTKLYDRIIRNRAGYSTVLKMNISNNSKMFLEKCSVVSFIVHSPSSSYIRSSIAASVVNIVLAVAGTISNSLVLFIFWKSPKLRSKLFSFAIMLLCSTDLGVGTVAHPLFALHSITTMLDSPKCLYIGAFTVVILFFSGISACTLLMINIERYFAIIHPFLYQIYFIKRRFVFTWIFFWFLVVVFIVCYIYLPFSAAAIPVTLCIIVFTSLFTYVAIYFVARKKRKRNDVHRNSNQESRKHFMAFLRELKMAKTYVLIVSLCVFCYLPTVVVIGIFVNISNNDDKTPDCVLRAFDWVATLTSMNSSLNCLIFFWGNRELRKEGSKVLKKCFCREEVQ